MPTTARRAAGGVLLGGGAQVRQQRLDDERVGGEVDVDDRRPVLLGEVADRVGADRAGRVDEAVDPAEEPRALLDRLGDRVRVGHVDPQPDRRHPGVEFRAQRRADFEDVVGHVPHRDRPLLGQQHLGGRPTDAGRAAGDHDSAHDVPLIVPPAPNGSHSTGSRRDR
jgi:hypothetical protein